MNTRNQDLIYGAEYARQYPIMRDKWRGRTLAECFAAKVDIFDTLTLHNLEGAPAYVAKLYAELDAIRDYELATKRAGK